MGYLGYYFAWLALSYLIRQPWLLLGLGLLWLVRGLLPPPGALFGALSRAGRLREQVRVNRANVTARRDLASIYIDLLRPRRALELLDEGLAVSPDDAELLYLKGLALHRAGLHEQALSALLAALDANPRLRHGLPYFVAGDVLLSLARWDDAADAFERYLDFASSDVAAHTRLARAYSGAGNADAARRSLLTGLRSWHELPGGLKRRKLGAYLKAQWARVTLLKEPLAIGVALVLAAGLLAGVAALMPWVWGSWRKTPDFVTRARAAAKACGSQRTFGFEGQYRLVNEQGEDASSEAEAEASPSVVVARDRIVIDRMEYCLSKVLEHGPRSLHAEAWLRYRADDGPAPLPTGVAEPNVESEELARVLLSDIRLDGGPELVRLRVAPVARPLPGRSYRLRRER